MSDQHAEKVRLAKTWNGNESGLLWEALWYRQDGRYYSNTFASGVFVPPHEYPDADTFWAAFERERSQFRGARFDGTSNG